MPRRKSSTGNFHGHFIVIPGDANIISQATPVYSTPRPKPGIPVADPMGTVRASGSPSGRYWPQPIAMLVAPDGKKWAIPKAANTHLVEIRGFPCRIVPYAGWWRSSHTFTGAQPGNPYEIHSAFRATSRFGSKIRNQWNRQHSFEDDALSFFRHAPIQEVQLLGVSGDVEIPVAR